MTWRLLSGWARYVTIPIASVLLFAACGTPGATAPGSATAPAATAAATEPPPAATATAVASACGSDPVTLVVADIEAPNPGPNAALETIQSEFMAKFPNVTIKRASSNFNDQQAKQPLELSGPNPPDVVEIVVANDTFAKFGNTGLIVKLDDYAKTYGWTDRFSGALLDQARFDADGQLGSGPMYGIYQVEDVVAIYYNKEKLTELGLQVPTTWEDFEASLAAAKAAGEVPMMLGNLDKWPAGHAYGIVYNRYASTADINGWTWNTKPDVSWDSQPFLDATTLFQSWGDQDYFTPDFNAVTYDDAWTRFSTGEGLYLPAGTWLNGGLQEAMGDKVGLFIPPASKHDPGLQIEGGQGQFWALSGKSANPDCGAAYLDFMTSERAGEILISNGIMPGFAMSTKPAIDPGLTQDLYDAIQTINSTYEVSTYEGTSTPSIGDVVGTGLQQLLVGKMTPDAFVKSMQADHDKFWK